MHRKGLTYKNVIQVLKTSCRRFRDEEEDQEQSHDVEECEEAERSGEGHALDHAGEHEREDTGEKEVRRDGEAHASLCRAVSHARRVVCRDAEGDARKKKKGLASGETRERGQAHRDGRGGTIRRSR